MLDNNYRMISPRYSREDYLQIDLKINSPEKAWNYAVEIFENRFNGRYFSVIDLLERHLLDYGFAIMTLNCLLIEALMQFREGYPETPRDANIKEYKNFLVKHLGFNENSAKRFYKEIRCGLLHSAETKNGSFFKIKNSKMIGYGQKGVLYVDINQVTKKIRDYFNMYCSELRDQESVNTELRANFIKKMDDITLKIDGYGKTEEVWNAICSHNNEIIELSNNRHFRLFVPWKTDDYLLLKSKGHKDITIERDIIKRAMGYWPSRNAICTLEYGEYIVPLLEKCSNLLDSTKEKTA